MYGKRWNKEKDARAAITLELLCIAVAQNAVNGKVLTYNMFTDTHEYFYTNEFSNWHRCPVKNTNIGYVFPTSEHAFMWEKANFFRDDKACQRVFEAGHPRDVKAIGREVKNYNDELWNIVRYSYMVLVNYWKFTQNDHERNVLLSSLDRTLVEASPYDKIWGVGLTALDPRIKDEKNWLGLNLLGKGLVEVREIIRKELTQKEKLLKSF